MRTTHEYLEIKYGLHSLLTTYNVHTINKRVEKVDVILFFKAKKINKPEKSYSKSQHQTLIRSI